MNPMQSPNTGVGKKLYQHRDRPRYFAEPHYRRTTAGRQERVPRMFDVWESTAEGSQVLFTISNRGDRLNELCKRGIPLEDARILFYQLDGE